MSDCAVSYLGRSSETDRLRHNGAGGSDTRTLPTPTGSSADDLLICHLVGRFTAGLPGANNQLAVSGWTTIANVTFSFSDNSGHVRQVVAWKWRGSDTSVTATYGSHYNGSSSNRFFGHVHVIGNAGGAPQGVVSAPPYPGGNFLPIPVITRAHSGLVTLFGGSWSSSGNAVDDVTWSGADGTGTDPYSRNAYKSFACADEDLDGLVATISAPGGISTATMHTATAFLIPSPCGCGGGWVRGHAWGNTGWSH